MIPSDLVGGSEIKVFLIHPENLLYYIQAPFAEMGYVGELLLKYSHAYLTCILHTFTLLCELDTIYFHRCKLKNTYCHCLPLNFIVSNQVDLGRSGSHYLFLGRLVLVGAECYIMCSSLITSHGWHGMVEHYLTSLWWSIVVYSCFSPAFKVYHYWNNFHWKLNNQPRGRRMEQKLFSCWWGKVMKWDGFWHTRCFLQNKMGNMCGCWIQFSGWNMKWKFCGKA